jgi:hypothetical protein
MDTLANAEQEKLAELSHEQLWHVCQRKPSDFEPYGQANALDNERLLRRLQVVPSLQRETHLMCETALMGRNQVLTSF